MVLFKFLIFLLGNIMTAAYVRELSIVTVEQQECRSVLTTPALAVQFPLQQEDKELIAAMKHKLQALGGVGLAAPQINYGKQIIAIYIPEEASLLRDNVHPYPMHIMLNPVYQPVEEIGISYDFEGCYSVSSKSGKVPRYNQIALSYYDENGQQHQQIEQGFYARVLQHEIDHLQGVLIIDRLTPNCVQGPIAEMMALRRAELSNEKKIIFDQVMEKKIRK